MRRGTNHINKEDFFSAHSQARMETYKEETIRSRFKATGLVPYDPIQVLSQLHPYGHQNIYTSREQSWRRVWKL